MNAKGMHVAAAYKGAKTANPGYGTAYLSPPNAQWDVLISKGNGQIRVHDVFQGWFNWTTYYPDATRAAIYLARGDDLFVNYSSPYPQRESSFYMTEWGNPYAGTQSYRWQELYSVNWVPWGATAGAIAVMPTAAGGAEHNNLVYLDGLGHPFVIANNGAVVSLPPLPIYGVEDCATSIGAGDDVDLWVTRCDGFGDGWFSGDGPVMHKAAQGWEYKPGAGRHITVAPDTGAPWLVTDAGSIYKWVGPY